MACDMRLVPPGPEYFYCPVCGGEIYRFVFRKKAGGELVGCEDCIGAEALREAEALDNFRVDLADVLGRCT